MKLTWIGHSCFVIEKDGYRLVIDPYTVGSVPGLDPVAVQAHQVLCSHEHGDHNGRAEVKLISDNTVNPFRIEALQTWHDEVQGAKRGKNQIFIIDDGENRIAHLGDLGYELTEEQAGKLQNLDALLIPVGGFYTIDGQQAADLVKQLNPKLTIPIHFRDDQAGFGYAEIGTAEEFTKYMDSVSRFSISEIELDSDRRTGVVVLKPERSE